MIKITIKWGTDKEETKTYTFENKEQAKERSSSYRNKGIESAKACLKILLDG